MVSMLIIPHLSSLLIPPPSSFLLPPPSSLFPLPSSFLPPPSSRLPPPSSVLRPPSSFYFVPPPSALFPRHTPHANSGNLNVDFQFASHTPINIDSPYRGGRPIKTAHDYDGSPDLVTAKLEHNSKRRKERARRKMSGAKFSRGRPIKLEGTEKQLIRRKHRRRQREIQKQMHQLEKLCAPFGSPAQFEGILKSVSSTRPGKTLLPEVASNSRTPT